MPIIDPDVLRNIPLFALLDNQEIEALAQQLDERHILAGQRIFSQGDPGDAMFIVQAGKVELFLHDRADQRVFLETVEPGGLFGELSLLDNQPRSATARAVDNSELLVVDRNDLTMLVKTHPHAALDLLAVLGMRIRLANLLVQERVTRNVNEEIAAARPATFGEKLSDLLTVIAGDIRFVYLNGFLFVAWLIWNSGSTSFLTPFDPQPYGLLTMIVSLEAIFLSLFVLISQNRQAARDKIRNDIEYEVNLKAEVEIRQLGRQVEELQQLMLTHLSAISTQQRAAIKQNNQRGVEGKS